MKKTIQQTLAGMGLLGILIFTTVVAHAYTLSGTPPIPEVTGIPSYVQAVAIGSELASVTNEKTGRTFTPVIEKNLGGGTYSVVLRESQAVE